MSARLFPVRGGFLPFFCISFLFNLIAFSAPAFPQTVDPTFAPLLQDFGNTSNRPSARVSALQPDGKILVGGIFTVASGLARSGVARFNPDGTPDPGFDAGNIGVAEQLLTVTTGGTIEVIKLYADGKILIGGNFRRDDEGVNKAIERLNPNGSVDANFQSAIVNAGIGDIEIQADGKIVVGGNFEITATNPANGQTVAFRHLARLNPDGSFDFTFTGNALENSDNIVIQADGKIVVGNASTNATPDRLTRYNTNGTIDTVLTQFDNSVQGLELLPDGKFLAVGLFHFVNGTFMRRVARINADGSLDTSFSSGDGFMSGLTVEDVAIQPDGKLVIAGDFQIFNDATRWRVARLNQDGSIDTTFNTSTPIAGNVNDVLILPDGKVFIGGAFPLPSNTEFYTNIGRLNTDGSIDTTFNNANVIFEGEGYSILQQPDGKILIGGFMYYAENVRRRGIARYNADGTLDAGFVPFQNLSSVQDIALQADGKILVVNGDSPSTLLRLNADGSQDAGFNAPFVPFSASIQRRTRITTVLVLPDGRILVGGQLITGSATSPSLSGLIRLNPDGSRDTGFPLVGALGGTRNVHDIAVQPDGKIVIGGDFTHINNNSSFSYLARINADGSIDTTFNPPAPPSKIAVIYEIELQPEGKIVYAGNFNFVLRVNANGTPDAGFSVPVNDGVRALLAQPNGKILVGGYFTSIGGAERKRIARLNNNGSLDAAFNLPNGANNIVYDFAPQTDGKILVAGAFTKLGNQQRIGAARLIETTANLRTQFDFDGDGRADVSVFRPSDGAWYLLNSTNGFTAAQFGIAIDKIAPADFDGDRKTDIAVFRDDTWYWLNSTNNSFSALQFGASGDIPVPADYTGDGRAELAVYRGGNWYTLNLANNQFQAVQFGVANDKPVPADFDGDGKTDFAVFRDGVWYMLGSTGGFTGVQFGVASDKPVVGDYDGDGKSDQAVYRSGVWYVLGSAQGFTATQFGVASDVPAAADFDGDGKADFAVFRDGVWYLQRTQAGFTGVQFGAPADKPVPAAFVP